MDVNQRDEFRNELLGLYNRKLGESRTMWSKGEKTFIEYLLWYFRKDGSVPRYEYGGLYQHLPEHMLEAWNELRFSTSPVVQTFRDVYIKETDGRPIPDLTNPGSPGATYRALKIEMVRRTVSDASECPAIAAAVEFYLKAKDLMIEHALHRFNIKVYRQGWRKLVKDCDLRGMSGTFGSTELLSMCTAGRIVMTFVRKRGEERDSVTFVADESDGGGYSTGIQSLDTDYAAACAMLDEVAANWPTDAAEQRNLYKGNKEVGFGF